MTKAELYGVAKRDEVCGGLRALGNDDKEPSELITSILPCIPHVSHSGASTDRTFALSWLKGPGST